jgi:hypothetical protein
LTAIRRHRPGQAKERDNPQETDEFECHNNGGKLIICLAKRKPTGLPMDEMIISWPTGCMRVRFCLPQV